MKVVKALTVVPTNIMSITRRRRVKAATKGTKSTIIRGFSPLIHSNLAATDSG